MGQVAAIDIGTNTLLLLVAERSATGELVAVDDRCRFGRLGQGLDRSGRLHPDAIARSLAICREYRDALASHAVGRLRVIGTQALREASNAAEFVAEAERLLGAPIEVVSGEREAALVHRSVVRAFPALAGEEIVIADVGGGSTEIIVGQGERVRWWRSLPIGAVRLSERHLASDPASASEIAALHADIDGALAGLALPHGATLVGTAGTATTFATVAQALAVYDPARVQGYRLAPAEVDRLATELLALPLAAKRTRAGIEPARADVIAGGSAIYARLVRAMAAREMITSDRGVRWGVAHELDEGGA